MLNIYSEEYIFSFKILLNFLEKKTKIAFKKNNLKMWIFDNITTLSPVKF
jgi:hypothetical protein